MFGRKKTTRPAKISSLVGPQTEISGDVNFSSGLHIDGTVKGNVIADVDADALLIVSESGTVQGEVRAPFIIINGTVDGDVHCSERLELTSKARIKGNVYYNLVEMSIGAEVNGSLIHYLGAKPGAAAAAVTRSASAESAKTEPRGPFAGGRPGGFGPNSGN